jgi:2,4-dienoyl-CoA reductase-like NADH-dependent reductase (Old Yellow Enzyme family)
MKTLFDKTEINGLVLKNRFVRSATQEALAGENGSVSDALIRTYGKLAEGNVGLIIAGWAFILPDGQALPAMLGIHDDSLIAGYQELTQEVHKYDTKIILQIGYGGTQSPFNPAAEVYSPSSIPELASGRIGKEMSADDITRLKQAFAEAARRAKLAGFDGVQIHAAHGFLLNQFLSPYYNRRTDQYGGIIENRARIILEIYQAIRREVGSEFPILAKINCADFIESGLEFDDSLYVCEQLAKLGIDALEISGGMGAVRLKSTVQPNILSAEQEGYFAEYAAEIAAKIHIPVILVGGLRSVDVMNRLLNETKIASFSMCRPFLAEPDLVNQFQKQHQTKCKCISCNKCITPKGIYCTVFNKC